MTEQSSPPAALAGRRRPLVALAAGIAVAAAVVAWLAAAHALWHSTVPAGLAVPRVDVHGLFSASFLRDSHSYDLLLEIDDLLAKLTLVAVLVVYARRGHVLMRESAAGPVGTGMLLGMLGFAIVWLAEIPFGLVAVWWERRHGVSHQGYLSSVLDSFLSLGGTFLFVCFALLVAMGFARFTRRWWWALAAPLFAALALLLAFVSPFLVPGTRALNETHTKADVRALARAEGVPGTHAEVEEVRRFTTAPNAEAVGFGSTRRLILWDTLLDGRFDRREVRVVVAHELGHIAHGHTLKRVGWLILFLIPAAGIVALATQRRGGLSQPRAVPLAVLVYVLLTLLAAPLMNIVSRHEEAEADWSALRATHDPQAARSLFERLATTSRTDPDPPWWSYVLDADHPTIAQRIGMVEAWQRRAGLTAR